jgi:hypothetical protein
VILGAGLLLLIGLGLLVAGVVTGVTGLYWGCVAVCVVAAVLLVLVRRQIAAAPTSREAEPAEQAEAVATVEPAEPAHPVEAVARRTTTATTEPRVAEPVPTENAAGEPLPAGATAVGASRPTAASAGNGAGPDDLDEPALEEVEVTDLLIIVDLTDEVLVVDEHPRYHLASCSYLTGRTTIPLPLDEARSDGFTPCGRCAPDRTLADRARRRKAAGSA